MSKNKHSAVPKTEQHAQVNLEPSGLCMNCMHHETCGFSRDPNKPVLFCEEYEIPVIPSMRIAEEKDITRKGTPATKEDLQNYRGLCVNCEHRVTCTYPKPEGGIWHCEEYE
jgi:hypothetical protein